ncbi:hypothetical protein [Streptomyces sp. Qhu_M48]|uniref:hypothetical protein n=1 Tax=Streptomyces sp. Qhu_M48 TaxID=3435889 RepID=UPI003F4FC222
MPTPHPEGDYAITTTYSVPDDAWYLELDEMSGNRTLVTAIVPDEDPARQPIVCYDPVSGHARVPYAVMRWFMDHVDAEVRAGRAWMELRPDLVAVIHRLRQEHLGVIGDDDVPPVLAEVRAEVPEEDLAAVMEAAFGRGPDGAIL